MTAVTSVRLLTGDPTSGRKQLNTQTDAAADVAVTACGHQGTNTQTHTEVSAVHCGATYKPNFLWCRNADRKLICDLFSQRLEPESGQQHPLLVAAPERQLLLDTDSSS